MARVTGLDRVGVEVACAVRPGGHILQVCNGKGPTFEAAARGARMETAELAAAEHVEATRLRFATTPEMRAAFPSADVVAPWELSGHAEPSPSLGSAWTEGEELLSGRRAQVPAWAVHCPPVGAALMGLALAPWTTNGMGAHPKRSAAREHALFEAVERDQLARALPDGWTEEVLLRGRLGAGTLGRHAPSVAAWVARLQERHFDLMLFDLSLPASRSGGLGVPLAAALLFDLDRGPVPLAAGYASRGTLEQALLAAFFEAAQSRLTDIHGAREDIAPADPDQVEAFHQSCVEVSPSAASKRRQETHFLQPLVQMPTLLRRIEVAGHRRVVAVDLTPRGWPVHVCKVLVPGFRLSELL